MQQCEGHCLDGIAAERVCKAPLAVGTWVQADGADEWMEADEWARHWRCDIGVRQVDAITQYYCRATDVGRLVHIQRPGGADPPAHDGTSLKK